MRLDVETSWTQLVEQVPHVDIALNSRRSADLIPRGRADD